MIELLKAIEKTTEYRFAECVDGIVTTVETGLIIPKEHMAYFKPPKEGFYEISKYVCEGSKKGGCDIGKPSKSCIDRKIYNPKKCSVYGFEKITNFIISFEQIQEIIKYTKGYKNKKAMSVNP